MYGASAEPMISLYPLFSITMMKTWLKLGIEPEGVWLLPDWHAAEQHPTRSDRRTAARDAGRPGSGRRAFIGAFSSVDLNQMTANRRAAREAQRLSRHCTVADQDTQLTGAREGRSRAPRPPRRSDGNRWPSRSPRPAQDGVPPR